MLGFFNEAEHKKWLIDNPQKRPKPLAQRTHVTHFYQGGSLCDKTGEQRQTEVKLKCIENSPSSSKVSLYLMEPQTCQYILGVESPLICEILSEVDSDGLVPGMSWESLKNKDSTGKGGTADTTGNGKNVDENLVDETVVEEENDEAPKGDFLGNGVVEDIEDLWWLQCVYIKYYNKSYDCLNGEMSWIFCSSEYVRF